MVRDRRFSVAALVVAGLVAGVFWGRDARAEQTSPLPLPKGPRYSVRFDSSPQQAAIYIDSKEYGVQGYTPAAVKLPKGNYSVILELPGYKPYQTDVTVNRAEAFMVALERAVRPSIIDLRSAADQSAVSATIIVDGQPVGSLPNQVEVAPGSHLVEVKRPEYQDYRDQVQVVEGERRTMVVTLAAIPKPGSILVTCDVDGAEVLVDGVSRDTTPAVINELIEGPHTVEVRKEGMPPWKQVVVVAPGKQAKVMANIRPAAPPPVVNAPPPMPVQPAQPLVGSLKVLSGTPLADVFLDGEPRGPANLEIREVRPGGHIVEVRAPGFVPTRNEVVVVAGELKVVQLDLSPVQAQRATTGTLRVISAMPDVDVFVDGAPVGKAPVVRNDVLPGKHFVVASKPGYAEFRTEVEITPDHPANLTADLRAAGSLRVISNVPGAAVFLDGAPVGVSPATLPDVPAGDHFIEVRQKGYAEGKQPVRIAGGAQQVLQVDLQALQLGPTLGDIERAQRMQSTYGATTLGAGKVNLDLGAGYPYFVDARLTVGIGQLVKKGPLDVGIDLGVEVRSNGYLTEAGLRPRIQVVRAEPFALGLDLALLGGGGPTKRNTFSFELGPIFSLLAGSSVHVNFKPYLWVSSDQLCPTVGDIQNDDMQTGVPTIGPGGKPETGAANNVHGSGSLYGQEAQVCKVIDKTRTGYALPGGTSSAAAFPPFGQTDPRDRFLTTRFMLQASLEVALTKGLNLWFLIEIDPVQDQRQAFTAKFDGAFPTTDLPIYGRAGITGKF